MPLYVYIATITGNTEIRKQVQRTLMILEGLGVPFTAIDITLRGNDKERLFMRENAVNQRSQGVPLPPQFFDNNNYIGNYLDFEEAVEDNHLTEFLRLLPPSSEESASTQKSDEELEDEDDGEDEEKTMDEEEEEDEENEEVDEDEEEQDADERESVMTGDVQKEADGEETPADESEVEMEDEEFEDEEA